MDRTKIAKKLVALRGKRKQHEIADKLGISDSAYSSYETGDRIPSDEVKIKIAELYKKSVQYIFYD